MKKYVVSLHHFNKIVVQPITQNHTLPPDNQKGRLMETNGKLETITVECKNERNNPMEASTA
jgi:hypothetical protein